MKNSMEMKRAKLYQIQIPTAMMRVTPPEVTIPEGTKASGIYRSIVDVFVYLSYYYGSSIGMVVSAYLLVDETSVSNFIALFCIFSLLADLRLRKGDSTIMVWRLANTFF